MRLVACICLAVSVWGEQAISNTTIHQPFGAHENKETVLLQSDENTGSTQTVEKTVRPRRSAHVIRQQHRRHQAWIRSLVRQHNAWMGRSTKTYRARNAAVHRRHANDVRKARHQYHRKLRALKLRRDRTLKKLARQYARRNRLYRGGKFTGRLGRRTRRVRYGRNIVRNGAFNGMAHWAQYRHHGGHAHMHVISGNKVMHLHGNCPRTSGGVKQVLRTTPGKVYAVNFLYWGGHWDGHDTDILKVIMGTKTSTFRAGRHHEQRLGYSRALKGRATFVAKSTSTPLMFWSGRSQCIDIDSVVVRPQLEGRNIVKNGAFNGMAHWAQYRHHGGHAHMHVISGNKVMHLHGNCPRTSGGVKQVLRTTPGKVYAVNFLYWGGHWDGHDTDILKVIMGTKTSTFRAGRHHEQRLGYSRALKGRATFVAKSTSTPLMFWSGRSQCIDIDSVVVRPQLEGRNIVKNGAFNGMAHWAQYRHHGGHAHMHVISGNKVMHLHGNCPRTSGGVKQVLRTKPGRRYNVRFIYWGGHWDGHDTDILTVIMGRTTRRFGAGRNHEQRLGYSRGVHGSTSFVARSRRTPLMFWAGRSQCIDMDNVVVAEQQGEKWGVHWGGGGGSSSLLQLAASRGRPQAPAASANRRLAQRCPPPDAFW
eukprot:CAMPEP_0204508082 /NCGR_PEP_ID=MMETSP0471-20130131/110089_1 /ASSEMBLY_ACC=CAM_ASM_000602 /TAXON_ID=2969 /ORGANISM="Oxyrrhis marina" /LENGTH=645 /DNA_ID=CAMNT_0051513117 /DNA_START=68 /DNA_END=2003 /DNA_ORIENTATION=+